MTIQKQSVHVVQAGFLFGARIWLTFCLLLGLLLKLELA